AFAQEEADSQHRNARFCAIGALVPSAHVQRNCSMVYIASILSSLPRTACEVLSADAEPLARTDSLFSVGISDIRLLSETSSRAGWIATTTDDILGEKQQLWDVLVELTPRERGSEKRWPRLRTSDGRVIQATQRDLRRYRLLRGELRRMRQARTRYRDSVEQDRQQSGDDDQTPLMRSATLLNDSEGHQGLRGDEDEVAEPVSWAALAYNGFMWWASTGEEDVSAMEESEADRELLSDLPDVQSVMEDPSSRAANGEHDDAEEELIDSQEVATVLTAFFHRITGLIVGTLADIVAEADDETEVGIEEDVIDISAEDVKKMGLDIWSERDREFVEEAAYFQKEMRTQPHSPSNAEMSEESELPDMTGVDLDAYKMPFDGELLERFLDYPPVEAPGIMTVDSLLKWISSTEVKGYLQQWKNRVLSLEKRCAMIETSFSLGERSAWDIIDTLARLCFSCDSSSVFDLGDAFEMTAYVARCIALASDRKGTPLQGIVAKKPYWSFEVAVRLLITAYCDMRDHNTGHFMRLLEGPALPRFTAQELRLSHGMVRFNNKAAFKDSEKEGLWAYNNLKVDWSFLNLDERPPHSGAITE
ncbi:hypothetical protein D0867_14218, partial [Hortaea werneckii]